MRLRNLDLNLLVMLDALLSERSVTRAARRLDLSQPTMSAALARLRRHFGDELLARTGNRYELTQLAAQLCPMVATTLAAAERVFASHSEFDPLSATRTFDIVTSDYGVAVVGPILARVMGEEAPEAGLRMTSFEVPDLDNLDEMLRRVDLLLMPHGVVSGFPHRDLFADEWVAIVDRDSTLTDTPLGIDELPHRHWVLTEGGRTGSTSSLGDIPVVRQMELLGITPHVSTSVDSFLALPMLVRGTDRLAVVQRRLVEPAAEAMGLRILSLPFTPVPLVEAAWWHPVHDRDAGHRWLRSCLDRVAHQLHR